MGLKICFISDTHCQHGKLKLPEDIDILIHCGDVSMRGNRDEVVDFVEWFSSQEARYKIMISGNHDYWFDKEHPRSANYNLEDDSHLDIIPEDIIYLQDSDITIEGIKVWGSPVTPWFHNWAFNKVPEDLETYWDIIPEDADIVITHGPPANTFLDKCLYGGKRAGCSGLYKRLVELRPKINCFGHIHEAYGVDDKYISDYEGNEKVTRLINCSVLDFHYTMSNEPVVVDWDEICKLHENTKNEKT